MFELYKNVIVKLMNIKSLLEEINYNVGVKSCCLQLFVIFVIYIKKLKIYLRVCCFLHFLVQMLVIYRNFIQPNNTCLRDDKMK